MLLLRGNNPNLYTSDTLHRLVDLAPTASTQCGRVAVDALLGPRGVLVLRLLGGDLLVLVVVCWAS